MIKPSSDQNIRHQWAYQYPSRRLLTRCSAAVRGEAPPRLRLVTRRSAAARRAFVDVPPPAEARELRHEGGLVSGLSPGLLLTTCGHAAHLTCWQNYMDGLLRRVAMQESFEGEGLARPQRGEFLCPVCRRLANVLLPVASCEPPTIELPTLEADAPGAAPDTAAWAAEVAASYAPEEGAVTPERPGAPSVPLRRQIESFTTLAACTLLRLPQMSIDERDWRALRMPAAVLAHNARLTDVLSRLPPSAASAEASALERPNAAAALRALWMIARAAPRTASVTLRAIGPGVS